MNFVFIRLIILICVTILIPHRVKAGSKYFKVERPGDCPGTPKTMPIRFINISTSLSKELVLFRGSIVVKEPISGDLALRIEAHRCQISGTGCLSYANATYKKLCDVIENNILFGNKLPKMTSPPFHCNPLQAGTYSLHESPIDTTPFMMMPVDGYKWKPWFYLTKSSNMRQTIGCFYLETAVYATSSRGSKGRG